MRCARVWMDARRVVHCVAAALFAASAGPLPAALHKVPLRHGFQHDSRGESGWCSDMTSTHGAWRHAGAGFLLSGELRRAMRTCLDGRPPSSPLRCSGAPSDPCLDMPRGTACPRWRRHGSGAQRGSSEPVAHWRWSFMGRGDTQGFDSSSPASCGVRCARVWTASGWDS